MAGALAVPAGAARPAAFSLSVTPSAATAAPGQRHFSESIRVVNAGTVPLKISASVRQLSGKTCSLSGAPSWASLSGPSGFTLKPGQGHETTFTLKAPASVTGTADEAAIFSGVSAQHAASGATLAGAVGSRVIMPLGGRAAAAPQCAAVHHPVAAPPHTTVNLGLVALLAILAALVAMIVMAIRRRLRRT